MTEKLYCMTSKITPPTISTEVIERKRLYDLFHYGKGSKITIVSAPSGYGKTVLISQFVHWSNQITAWYQLDKYDNDILTFIRYIITSISKHHLQFGAQLLKHLEQPGETINEMRLYVILLIKEIEAWINQPLILVLEDYHLITNPRIHQFLQELIMDMPKNLHIVLSSRFQVPLNITRLISHGTANLIEANNLKFTSDEIKTYFSREFHFHEEIFNKIQNQTDGWAVGISLIKLSLPANKKIELPQTFINKKNKSEVYNYFMEEIYSQLSQELKTFLLATSILDELSVSVCDSLLDIQNSNRILEILKQKNLFILELETADGHYRYHQLFKRFLQEQLYDKKPYYIKAAGYYLSTGELIQAIDYYILGEAYELAIYKIKNIGISLLEKGSTDTVERWLEKLPNHLFENNKMLLLMKGIIYNQKTKWEKSLITLDKAIQLSKNTDKQAFAKGLFYKANTYRKMGRYEDSLDIINQIIPFNDKENIRYWYRIILEKVNILLWIGKLDEAIYSLKVGVDRARKDANPYLVALFLEHIGAMYYTMGEYYKAVDYYQQAYNQYDSLNDSISEFEKEYYSQRTTLARIYRDWGEVDKAYELIKEEIATKEKLGFLNDLPRAYHQLALIYHDFGKRDMAIEYFEKASSFYNQLNIHDFQWTWHEALYGKILIDYGEKQKGIYLINKAINQSQNNSEFNIALCNFFGCYMYLAMGEINRVFEILDYSLSIAQKVNAKYLISLCHMMKANIYIFLDKKELALEHTTKCLELANKNNYLQGFVGYNPKSNPIVKFAKKQGLYDEFINKILMSPPQKEIDIYKMKKRSSDPMIKASIFVQLFGNTVILNQDRKYLKDYQLKTTKAKELIAYLLINNKEGNTKEEILEALWPEKDPKKSSNLLYTYSYEIRSLLKKIGISKGIQYENKRYCINNERIDSDVVQFTSVAKSLDIKKIEHAIEIYSDKFMNSFDNPWILNQRISLENSYIKALFQAAKYYIELKNYDKSKIYLEQLIETDNLSEKAYELLMGLHIEYGNNIAAIRTFKSYKNILDKELGIHPNGKMIELYEIACKSSFSSNK